MAETKVRKAVLVWWLGGLLLGLTQVAAVGLKGPLGVSTQFVVLDSMAIQSVDPDYVAGHKMISKEKYTTLGYGFWLDVGLIVGALVTAIAVRRWKLQMTTVWWRATHGASVLKRLLTGFVGGFLILMGARMAHGCTSGQFASGWAQLSLSVVPFTITMFAFGMLTAWLVYPKTPEIER